MTDITTIHQPVLLSQCVDLVAPALEKPGSVVVDCTLGLAGHTIAFLKAAPQARVLGIGPRHGQHDHPLGLDLVEPASHLARGAHQGSECCGVTDGGHGLFQGKII